MISCRVELSTSHQWLVSLEILDKPIMLQLRQELSGSQSQLLESTLAATSRSVCRLILYSSCRCLWHLILTETHFSKDQFHHPYCVIQTFLISMQVNAVAPGFIASDMTGKLSKEIEEAVLKNIPLGEFFLQ